MHIQPIFLIFLLVLKMAQLKHTKKVEPNDAFIGILILYLLIQSLTSNTKEFAIPGATNTEIDPTAWWNLHELLKELYSSNTLTIPGNVHIKGDLLVGSYKGSSADGTISYTFDAPWAASITNVTDWRENKNAQYAGYALAPKTGTGRIYSWEAKHQEVNTQFICRNRPQGDPYRASDTLLFTARSHYHNPGGSVQYSHIGCGDIQCGNITVAPDKWIRCNNLAATDGDNVTMLSNLTVGTSGSGKSVNVWNELKVNSHCRFEQGVRIQGIKTTTNYNFADQGGWLRMHGDAVKCYGVQGTPAIDDTDWTWEDYGS